MESAKLDINPREERLSKMNVISESIIGKSNFYFIISPLNGDYLNLCFPTLSCDSKVVEVNKTEF